MHQRLLVTVALIGVLACAAALPRVLWAYNGFGGIPVTSENNAYENEAVTLINQARTNPGSFGYPNYEAQPPLTKHKGMYSELLTKCVNEVASQQKNCAEGVGNKTQTMKEKS